MAAIFACNFVLSCAFGGLSPAPLPPEKEGEKFDVNDLSAVDRPFKVAPYVRAAALLQKMGQEEACKQLTKVAKEGAIGPKEGDDGQIAILCRMLFSKKGETEFRAPRFGAPVFLGGTRADDWPLTPLELVDGVPFYIVSGHNLAGSQESSHHYLKFCLENCQWSDTRFDKVTKETMEKALEKLLASKKWKKALEDGEREHLRSQIKQKS